jgi:putative nucleotidyltransferase with HDIG domain
MHSVLFVDDEPHILSSLKREFRDFSRPVHLADSALKGLQLLEQHPIGVVVSDNDMPVMGGVEFLSQVRSRWPDVSRIMLTGKANMQVAIEAINRCGASQFITKPWNVEEIRRVVEESLEQHRMVQTMRSGREDLYRALVHTVELKDPYTRGHSDRVADYAVMLGRSLGLPPLTLQHLRNGSILHDCGKIGVPELVLNKPGRLSEVEFEQIKHHPVQGGKVARQANLPSEVINIITYHHERFCGGGYPEGLVGNAIPLEAQIVAIADVFDALTSSRPYRDAISHNEAFNIMQYSMAEHFAPELLQRFCSLDVLQGMLYGAE